MQNKHIGIFIDEDAIDDCEGARKIKKLFQKDNYTSTRDNGRAVVVFIGASVTTLPDEKRASVLTGELDQGTCLLTLFRDASTLSHWIEFEAGSEIEAESSYPAIHSRWTERFSLGIGEEQQHQQPFSDVYRVLSNEAEDKESPTTYGQYGNANGTASVNRWRSSSSCPRTALHIPYLLKLH